MGSWRKGPGTKEGGCAFGRRAPLGLLEIHEYLPRDERKIHFSLPAASVYPTSIFSRRSTRCRRVSTYELRRRRKDARRVRHERILLDLSDSLARMKVYIRFLPICPRNPANPALVTRNDAFKLAGGFSQAIAANAVKWRAILVIDYSAEKRIWDYTFEITFCLWSPRCCTITWRISATRQRDDYILKGS